MLKKFKIGRFKINEISLDKEFKSYNRGIKSFPVKRIKFKSKIHTVCSVVLHHRLEEVGNPNRNSLMTTKLHDET